MATIKLKKKKFLNSDVIILKAVEYDKIIDIFITGKI
jgi:hypothetical protein